MGKSTWSTFLQRLEDGQLWGIVCKSCRNLSVFPRSICNLCSSQKFEFIIFSGKGRVSTFTHVFVTSKSMSTKGYGTGSPYCSGIVTLDEGPSVPGIIQTSQPVEFSYRLLHALVSFESCEILDNRPTFKFRLVC